MGKKGGVHIDHLEYPVLKGSLASWFHISLNTGVEGLKSSAEELVSQGVTSAGRSGGELESALH